MKQQKEDILKNIPPQSKKIIDDTTICTIYNGETKTWGIVTRPNKFLISFRLKNPLSTRLKAACRSLILSLRNYNGAFALDEKEDYDEKKDFKNNDIASFRLKLSNFNLFSMRNKKERFKFSSIIEILEPGSEQSSFHGKIIQGSAFKATKEEKKTEISVLICTFIFTVVLLYITSPYGIDFSSSGAWKDWWEGNLQRVSTAAIVTMLVSIINLIFHWTSIRREYPIRWIAEDVNE